jgi:hypothetical protein
VYADGNWSRQTLLAEQVLASECRSELMFVRMRGPQNVTAKFYVGIKFGVSHKMKAVCVVG